MGEEKIRTKVQVIWALCLAVSLVIISAIVVLFYLVHTSYIPNPNQLTSKVELDQYFDQFSASEQQITEAFKIPTGIFLQSFYFQDANTVHISGYVWQKYTKGKHDRLERGFILPESIDSKITEVYRHQTNDHELVGWYFESKILENFDYSKYPLDNKTIWLRLWHKERTKNIILVPDFESFVSTKREDKFGIDNDIVLSGFGIHETFFSYSRHPYDSNFGKKITEKRDGNPELYFNVSLKRNFTSAFFMHLFPIMLVALVTFALCLNMHNGAGEKNNAQFTLSGMISGCTGLIFITVLIHMNLRSSTITGDFVFIESLYLLIICFLTFLVYNAVAVAHPESRMARLLGVNYRNNLVIRVLYWPTLLTISLVFSILWLV